MAALKYASLLAAASLLVIASERPAHADLIYATDVDWQNNGTVGSANDRNDSSNGLGATDGEFFSLGLTDDVGNIAAGDPTSGTNPGFAVFAFGQTFKKEGMVYEVTFGCEADGDSCGNHPEQVQIFAGNDYVFGSNDITDLADFTRVGELGNATAQSGGGVTFNGPFTYLALIDTSKAVGSESFDGFDVDSVGVQPVPAPATLGLLGAGLLGLGGLARWRKAR
jgi:hypothetical protein